MPYIEVTQVAQIRSELKKQLPEFKFSVTREHYSSISVSILSGPIKLSDKPYEQVNQYYIKEHYEGEAKKVLLKVNAIVSKDERTMFIDSDYGSVPNFYIHMSVGKWDKPYQLNN